MEPEPSNITGEVVHRHSFEHRINWGQVALALAGLAVAYFLFAPESGVSEHAADMESDAVSDRVTP